MKERAIAYTDFRHVVTFKTSVDRPSWSRKTNHEPYIPTETYSLSALSTYPHLSQRMVSSLRSRSRLALRMSELDTGER